MSYTSESTFDPSVKIMRVRELIELLGYKRNKDGLKVPGRIQGYFWYDRTDYRSWSGVELDLYQAESGSVVVGTRSTVSRSYWDLTHQNRTIKLLRDAFGGTFHTGEGKSRYLRPGSGPPAPVSSGCFLARWGFKNSFMRSQIYLMSRKLEGDVAREKATGLTFMDALNPRLLSNNLLVPYMLAVWEEYFRATFTACLRYSKQREGALKRARLSHAALEELAVGSVQVERSVAEFFAFQRPSSIAEAFRLLDPKLDLAAPMKRPYRKRKLGLYESIESLVEGRNRLVHEGELDMTLYDAQLKRVGEDLTEAVNRCYASLGKHFGFVPIHDY